MTIEDDIRTARVLLSVCRASYEWLSPIVYNSVALTHPRTMVRFARAVSANPTHASSVRSLWVGPVSIQKTECFAFLYSKSCCNAEREQITDMFVNVLLRILTRCRDVVNLSLIHCPLVSTSQWNRIEHALPPGLQTLVMGPDHAMLGAPTFYRSLRHLISIETTLVHVELAHITAFPSLTTLEWRFLPDSPVMALEYRDPGKFGEKLFALLQSPTLRHVRVMHETSSSTVTSPLTNSAEDNHSLGIGHPYSSHGGSGHTLGHGALGSASELFPRNCQKLVMDAAQGGHRVKLEFKRRSHGGKLQPNWISLLYDEWKKSVVTRSSLAFSK